MAIESKTPRMEIRRSHLVRVKILGGLFFSAPNYMQGELWRNRCLKVSMDFNLASGLRREELVKAAFDLSLYTVKNLKPGDFIEVEAEYQKYKGGLFSTKEYYYSVEEISAEELVLLEVEKSDILSSNEMV